MSEIIYEGQHYYEPDRDTLTALHAVGIHTFRYYPQQKLMIGSDVFAEHFRCRKFLPNMPESLAKELIDPSDWGVLSDLEREIAEGAPKASAILTTKDGMISKVTVSALSRDTAGNTTVAVGIVEPQEEDIRTARLIQALGSDFASIYYVDFEKDHIIPYRLSPVIEREYGEYFRCNPQYERAINAYVSHTVAPDEREEMLFECSVRNLNRQLADKDVYTHDYKIYRDGQNLFFRMKVVCLARCADGKIQHAVMGFADVSRERKRDLERYAYVDSITGGDNYVRFKENLEQEKEAGFLVAMDVHEFKAVNAACGIRKGDEVLRRIGQIVGLCIGSSGVFGHINADHFSLYIRTDEEKRVAAVLNDITQKIVQMSSQMSIPHLEPYFGAAFWEPGTSIEISYGEATAAKHEIKDRKDINFTFYSQVDLDRLMERKWMEDSFETAIVEKQFEIWYQPKYSPQNGKLAGAEALIRWRKKDGGLLFPGSFIPVFEKNGTIRVLDEYVFKAVCRQQKQWQAEGRELFPVSVNLSRASLYFQNITEKYLEILDEFGLDPALVPLEITESAAINDSVVETLTDRLDEVGFPIHMDDFGNGYSSLASLSRLHIDTLKLDKTLIDFIGSYRGDRMLVHTIALAKELGIKVVAEGVEEKSQVEFLLDQDCDAIQGYYYSKPLPYNEFMKLIDDQK